MRKAVLTAGCLVLALAGTASGAVAQDQMRDARQVRPELNERAADRVQREMMRRAPAMEREAEGESLSRKERRDLLCALSPAREFDPRIALFKAQIQNIAQADDNERAALLKAARANAKEMLVAIDDYLEGLRRASAYMEVSESEALVTQMRENFEEALEDLESEDRLGNFEIQRLMQIIQRNETLASDVRKKDDDRENAIIGKI